MTILNTTYVNQVSTGNSDVKVLPNPNNGIFTITGNLGTNDDMPVTIEVLDLTGRIVYSSKVTALNGTLNERVQLSGAISNGSYLLNLHSEAANQVFHIVVAQ
jgi:hypothetical protein